MKYFFSFCISIVLLIGCNTNSNTSKENTTELFDNVKQSVQQDNVQQLDSSTLGIQFKPKGNYNNHLRSIKQQKAYFKNQLSRNQAKALDSCKNYIYNELLNTITPFWYGTPWDFNGHTNIPNNGEIACGYFVSTTLKHLDFKLNRYKLAQQAGMNIALSLQNKNDIKVYRNVSYKTLKEKVLKTYTNGIYFVGLSNHVGYLLLKDKELYFLHASYCDNKVVIEKAEYSPCFQSDIYVFAEITTNTTLLKKWITSETVNVKI